MSNLKPAEMEEVICKDGGDRAARRWQLRVDMDQKTLDELEQLEDVHQMDKIVKEMQESKGTATIIFLSWEADAPEVRGCKPQLVLT